MRMGSSNCGSLFSVQKEIGGSAVAISVAIMFLSPRSCAGALCESNNLQLEGDGMNRTFVGMVG